MKKNTGGSTNRAFLFGDGLFETLLIIKGIAALLPFHAARLAAGMQVLQLGKNSAEILQQAILRLPPQATGRLRVQVWRDGAGAYAPETSESQWTSAFTPLVRDIAYPAPKPISCCLYPDIRTQFSPLSGLKTVSALPYVMAAMHARAHGTDEALLLSVAGHFSEASACNLFWIKDNQLFTPPLSAGCVAGVMRAVVMQLWLEITGRPVQEALLFPEKAGEQDAFFLTNAIRGIQPVSRIGEQAFAPNHPLTGALQQALSDRMGGFVT